ncbi:MAG: hypothetical protein NUW23_01700 [Firmicutes bacterium]|nr:hypothetical protein [Bacillota bacterium]
MNIFTVFNWLYRAMLIYMGVFLVWNMFEHDNVKEQVMTVLILIPIVFRVVGLK